MISIVNISGKYDHVAKCSVAPYGQNDLPPSIVAASLSCDNSVRSTVIIGIGEYPPVEILSSRGKYASCSAVHIRWHNNDIVNIDVSRPR